MGHLQMGEPGQGERFYPQFSLLSIKKISGNKSPSDSSKNFFLHQSPANRRRTNMARKISGEDYIIKFGEEIKQWVGEEFGPKTDYPMCFLTSSWCDIIVPTTNLNEEDQRRLKARILTYLHFRSEESTIEKVKFGKKSVIFTSKHV